MSNDIPVLNGFVNTIDWDQHQSDLSDLTLSMRRVTGSPWIADFRCLTWPEVARSRFLVLTKRCAASGEFNFGGRFFFCNLRELIVAVVFFLPEYSFSHFSGSCVKFWITTFYFFIDYVIKQTAEETTGRDLVKHGNHSPFLTVKSCSYGSL